MPNESERFATIYAQGHPIGFMITRVMGFEIFDVDERPLAFVYSQREGIEICSGAILGNGRRGIGENEKWPPGDVPSLRKAPTRGRGLAAEGKETF